jgi:hypothetical protein
MYITNPIKKFEERSSGLFSTHRRRSTGSTGSASSPGEQPLDAA